jgi:hypothetical protein
MIARSAEAPARFPRLRARMGAAADWVREMQCAVAHELFEEDGLNVMFQHARNVLSGTMIIAAGMYATHHLGASPLPGMWTLHVAGYVVTALGVTLLLLNLFDGLRRLARRRHHVALRVATIVIYLALSVRLTQVIVYFRAGP